MRGEFENPVDREKGHDDSEQEPSNCEDAGTNAPGTETDVVAADRRSAARAELCEFLATIAVGEYNFAEENDAVPFYESGMVDSLSMLELVSFLERRYAIDFSRIGIDVVSLGSIANILDLIEAKEP